MTIRHRLSLGLAGLALCSVGFAQQTVKLDIEAQPLDRALNSWATQTGYQVLIPVDRAARGRSAPPLKGHYTPEGALKVLLARSNLSYEFVNTRTVTIRAAEAEGGKADARPSEALPPLAQAPGRPREQAATDQTPGQPTEPATRSGRGPTEEVVVTAQKRDERLREVPVPVTAVSAESLGRSNQLQVQEYYTRVPGLSLNYDGIRTGLPALAIRGIRTSNGGNPTVGVVVDELSYGSSTAIGGGGWMPDFDPSDLQRVEVLRGPQGTLYGASSMGGLLKFVTVQPSTERTSGRLQVSGAGVRNGDGLSHGVRGSLNVPLSQTVAARASGFTRNDAGYIDNPVTGESGINETDAYGGSVAFLWQPGETFSLKLSGLFQKVDSEGSSNINPALGDLQQDSVRDTGWLDRQFQVYDATLVAKLGVAEVTSVTGYGINSMEDSIDATSLLGTLSRQTFGVAGATFDEDVESKKFSQEIRAAIPIGEQVQWLVGLYYADEDSDFISDQFAVDEVTGARVGRTGSTFVSPTAFEERAVFTNATWEITERFDIQLGGRYSENRIDASTRATTPAGVTTVSGLSAKDSVVTYLLTPRFRLSPDVMAYARFASGYRAGGVNLQALLPANADLPRSYQPDETRNYELGVKADTFGGLLSIDASVYYIDWRDIQLALVAPGRTAGFMDNGGRASSRGVELSIDAQLLTALNITGWVAFNEGELTEDFPQTSSVRGLDGDRLPFSSRWSSGLSATFESALTSTIEGSFGVSLSYVGERFGVFRGPPMTSPLQGLPRERYPSYTKVDVRAGFAYDTWNLDLFANNVTDERGRLSGGLGAQYPAYFTYIQPRSIGLSLTKTF